MTKRREGENGMVRPNVEVLIPAMADAGITQEEIAKRSGVSPGTVSRIKSGYLVRLDRLGKVCKFLGVPAKDGIIIENRREKQ